MTCFYNNITSKIILTLFYSLPLTLRGCFCKNLSKLSRDFIYFANFLLL